MSRLLKFIPAPFAIALLSALLASIALTAAFNDAPVILDQLDSPRGLHPLPDGGLLIAEGGGRLLQMSSRGVLSVVAEKLPTTHVSLPEGSFTVGPSGITQSANGTVYYITGEARDKGFREAYRLDLDGVPRSLTGQDPTGTMPLNALTNPFDIVPLDDETLLISDSGWNGILLVTAEGDIRDYASIPSPQGTDTPIDPVPTGMTRDVDGAVYVTTLTGFPHPRGAAAVYRILDSNGDGDALDAGEVQLHIEHLTSATDVALDVDGAFLVTEFSKNLGELVETGYGRAPEFPGRLIRWRSPDRGLEVVADGLVSPTAVAVTTTGRIFVSEEFAGRVVEIGTRSLSPFTAIGVSSLIGLGMGLLALLTRIFQRRQRAN